MARVFITGSSDGLGQMAAQLLIEQGHSVVLHARSEQRGNEALAAVPGAESVVIGDLTSIAQTRDVAEQVNRLGSFDAVIHNAGVGYREPRRIATEDGLPHVFAVNTLAPYILTALIEKPKRLVYLSSGLHQSGDASLKDLAWEDRPWRGQQAYSDTKLHDVLLGLRHRVPLAGCSLQRTGTRLGADQDGWPRAHPTTWTLHIAPRCGLRSARIRPRRSRASTSFTCGSAHRTPRPTMRGDRTHCSTPADVFRESKCPRTELWRADDCCVPLENTRAAVELPTRWKSWLYHGAQAVIHR